MMTDAEIIEVVTAHKEGKKIQCRHLSEDAVWGTWSSKTWNFAAYEYRVDPTPRKELWLQECTPKGLWQEKFVGLGRHFIKVEGATSGEPTVISSTVKTFDEINPLSPRKPRDFWLCNGRDRSVWLIVDKYHNPHSCGGEMIHAREVLE